MIATSVYSAGRMPWEFSITRVTSANCMGLCFAVPAKMTFSILSLRRTLVRCSPRTQRTASTRFDLPQPFGPTIPITPGENVRRVFLRNDLKPYSSRPLKYTKPLAVWVCHMRSDAEAGNGKLNTVNHFPQHGKVMHASKNLKFPSTIRAEVPRVSSGDGSDYLLAIQNLRAIYASNGKEFNITENDHANVHL